MNKPYGYVDRRAIHQPDANNTPLTMSRIESVIEFECTDWKPSDIEWTLLKKDVPEIAANIKRLLLEEIRKAPHTWEDAVETVNDF